MRKTWSGLADFVDPQRYAQVSAFLAIQEKRPAGGGMPASRISRRSRGGRYPPDTLRRSTLCSITSPLLSVRSRRRVATVRGLRVRPRGSRVLAPQVMIALPQCAPDSGWRRSERRFYSGGKPWFSGNRVIAFLAATPDRFILLAAAGREHPPYQDPSAPLEQRVDDACWGE